MADFNFGDAMLTEHVVDAVNGLMMQADPATVKGIHVTAEGGDLLDTTEADFATKFKAALIKAKAAITKDGKRRLAMAVRVGNHYVTVAIDTDPAHQQVVIVEPALAAPKYDAELAKIRQAIVEVGTQLTFPPTFAIANIQNCAVKVQNVPSPDDASCGPIASKMVSYLLTTNENLHDAINAANLAGKIITTPAQAKALFNEVKAAIHHQDRIDTGNCAVHATLMSIFNLVASDKLDTAGAPFDATRTKLLALYTAYLTKENGAAPAPAATWDQFKAFLKNAKTPAEQAAIRDKFTPHWREQFRTIFTNVATKNAYAANLSVALKEEFDAFYIDDNFDTAGTSYARFPWLQSEFAALKRTGKGIPWDDLTKTAAFNAWWNANTDTFFNNHLTKTGAWLSETDIAEYVKDLGNIDFDFQGRGKTAATNLYSPGYGNVTQARLEGLLDAAGFEPPPDADRTAIVNALCDDKNGILQKVGATDYTFRRMTDTERQVKLNKIAEDAWAGNVADPAKDIFKTALNALCNPKEPYQKITLSNDSSNHWEVVDSAPNSWLKEKDFTSQPKNNVSGSAHSPIDLSTAEAKDAIKKVCAELQAQNPTKRFAYNESNNTVDVCGHQVEAKSSGFSFKTVTDEIIEFTVKALAAQFDLQGRTKPVDRVVALTLSAENREKYYEKFKKACADMKPPLMFEEDVTNTLTPAAARP